MEMLGKLIGLPKKFLFEGGTGGGVIQGTASEAVIVCMLAAKEKAWRNRSELEKKLGIQLQSPSSTDEPEASTPPCPSWFTHRLVAYASNQAHSCVKKV